MNANHAREQRKKKRALGEDYDKFGDDNDGNHSFLCFIN